MARVMGIWLGQLRILLGVKERPGLSVLPVPHSGLRQGHITAFQSVRRLFFFGKKLTCLSRVQLQFSTFLFIAVLRIRIH
jgi:hypothetical protein